ncbi:MAG: hypothetical protein OEZ00_09845 [Dehalococcoidia bacterium]|nr:hypothetical protein [Dehalococcoidia bacterium]
MEIMAYVAIYAAVVATSALVWNIWRERRAIKVKLQFNWQPRDPDYETGEIVQIGFLVVNDGRYPVYIERVGVISSDGDTYSYHHSVFKVDRCVKPGVSSTFWMDVEAIKNNLKGKTIKYGFVEDATMKKYKKRISALFLS